MRNLKIYCILIIVIFNFCLCQKEPNKHIEVKANVSDWFTHQPLAKSMDLYAYKFVGAFGGSEDRYLIGTCNADAEGDFDIESIAYKSKDYEAIFTMLSGQQGVNKRFSVNDNSAKNLGAIDMPHTFTCKITLHSVSPNNEVVFDDDPSVIHTPGGSGTFYFHHGLTKAQYEAGGHIVVFNYKLNSTSHSLQLPIGSSDTVSATITY